MKYSDIQADGTVYWYDRRQEWGKYMAASYDRFPCVRVDDKRYRAYDTFNRGSYREDPKGSYVAGRTVDDNGTPEGKTRYVLTTHIRDTYTAVKAAHDRQAEAGRQAAVLREEQADAAAGRAKALRTRLAALGLADMVRVESTEGRAYVGVAPAVTVSLGETGLGEILARLEAKTDTAVWQAGYAEGELVADATRDAALGYTLRPEQGAALRRAENGAVCGPCQAAGCTECAC